MDENPKFFVNFSSLYIVKYYKFSENYLFHNKQLHIMYKQDCWIVMIW